MKLLIPVLFAEALMFTAPSFAASDPYSITLRPEADAAKVEKEFQLKPGHRPRHALNGLAVSHDQEKVRNGKMTSGSSRWYEDQLERHHRTNLPNAIQDESKPTRVVDLAQHHLNQLDRVCVGWHRARRPASISTDSAAIVSQLLAMMEDHDGIPEPAAPCASTTPKALWLIL